MRRYCSRLPYPLAFMLLATACTAAVPEPLEEHGTARLERDPGRRLVIPEGPSSPRGLRIELLTELGEPRRVEALEVLLVNEGREDVVFHLQAFAAGLDGRSATLPLGELRIEAGKESRTRVAAAQLPIQSFGSPSFAVLQAAAAFESGDVIELRSEPVYYDTAERTGAVTAYGRAAAADRYRRPSDEQLVEARGSVWNGEARAFVDVEKLEATGQLGPAYFDGVDTYPIEPEEENPTYVPGDLPNIGTRYCAQLTPHYVDSGFGEDYLKPSSFGYHGVTMAPASFARARIRPMGYGAQPAWTGYLDADGCTPKLVLLSAQYKLEVFTAFEDDEGMHIDVKRQVLWPDWPKEPLVWNYTVAFQPGGGAERELVFWDSGDVINVSAVVARALGQPDAGTRASTTEVLANVSCPNYPGDSCVSGQRIYIGTGTGNGADHEWKFVVAHELGHRVHKLSGTFPYYTSYNGSEIHVTEPLCRCDHVAAANSAHCMQSQEGVAPAQVEGFAQYYAAKMLNDSSELDCTMVYYKEMLFPVSGIEAPPIGLDCAAPAAWRNSHCQTLASYPNNGTEYDWMTFYVALDRSGGSIETIYDIYREACNGSCAITSVPWFLLLQGAEEHYGGVTTSGYQSFVLAGATHAVDGPY